MTIELDFSDKFSNAAKNLVQPSLREITLKVVKVSGINLGQGVCQLPVPNVVLQAAHRALDQGVNRYTSPRGLLTLREAIAKKTSRHNGFEVDAKEQVVITTGSTGAFEGTCAALLDPGDEVVSFSPFYPYHHNAVERYGARIRYVDLTPPRWEFTADKLEQAFSKKTKFVLINTPSNPTGKVFLRSELEQIGRLCEQHNCFAVSDEIYEYMVNDDFEHISPATIPSLRERTITIGGYSKTFAITGWRIGYAVAPAPVAEALARLLDSMYVCPPAPLQQGVADAIEELDDNFYTELRETYQRKRDYLGEALQQAGLEPIVPQGAYYMIAEFGKRFPDLSSHEFVDLLIGKVRVGAVPADDFVEDGTGHQWVRFCYAVEDDVLEQAAVQLKSFGK